MLELPADLQLLVFEYITSTADLRALCITCGTFRRITTPRMYHSIYLRLWDGDYVSRFFKSVATGAGQNLPYTGELVFEDAESPDEPGSLQSVLTKPAHHLRPVTTSERDERMFMVPTIISPPSGKSFAKRGTSSLDICFKFSSNITEILKYLLDPGSSLFPGPENLKHLALSFGGQTLENFNTNAGPDR
ncbi:hypothetical protein E8E11_003917 [Didymella keratinophila]|nr:hypothetical protein E8E11_003917 [Didymella keratinophila]